MKKSTNTQTKKEKQDAYEKINEVVIEGLKKEGLKWFMPWTGSEGPHNWTTEKPYKGFNVFWLNAVMRQCGYSANEWMTYNQAKANGGQVQKGSKSTVVYFWKISYQDKETKKYYNTLEDIKKAGLVYTSKRFKKCFTLRYFNVFNIDQIDGLEPKKIGLVEPSKYKPNEMAEIISEGYIKNAGPSLGHGGSSAHYEVANDHIQMPMVTDFIDTDTYYKTLFHEMAHSTGHPDRLKRDSLMEVSHWGDNTYAREELVAEISAMYLSGDCGLDPKDNHENSQAYIKSWCKKLKEHKKECVMAMTQALKCVDHIKEKSNL